MWAESVDYRGKEILYVDTTVMGDDMDKLAAGFQELLAVVEARPKGSVLLLIDGRGSSLSRDAVAVIKEQGAKVDPYARKTALVAHMTGFKRVILDSIGRTVGGVPRMFDDLEGAKEWLVSD
jgi:hypothetical protein